MPLCDSECTWGLKCLTYNRHMPARPATYEERLGYVYDANACGQGVIMYILDDRVNMFHDTLRYKLHDELEPKLPKFGTKERREFWKKLEKEEEEYLKKFKDENSHGTFVAGVARSVAKNADIISFKSEADFKVETDLIIGTIEMAAKRKESIMKALADVTAGTKTLEEAKAIIKNEMDLDVIGKEDFRDALVETTRITPEEAKVIIEKMTEMTATEKETITNALENTRKITGAEARDIMMEIVLKRDEVMTKVLVDTGILTHAEGIMMDVDLAGEEEMTRALVDKTNITRDEAEDIMMEMTVTGKEAMTKALVDTTKITREEATPITKNVLVTIKGPLEAKKNALMNTTIKITPVEARVVIEKVLEARPTVLNISASLQDSIVETIVKLIKAGVHVVIAAGNHNRPEGKDRYKEQVQEESDKKYVDDIIFVGASTTDDKIWGYSSFIALRSGSAYGPLVDVFAPGEFIRGAIHDESESDSELQGDGLRAMATWSGTSFAAPQVTGIVACLLSHHKYKFFTPSQMKAKIIDMAWYNVVEPVDDLYLVKKVLAYGLWETLWDLRSNKDESLQSDNLKTLFKEKGKLRVTAAYLDTLWQELNLLNGESEVHMTEFKKILSEIVDNTDNKGIVRDADNAEFIERKIESISMRLTRAHFADTTVRDFTTTRRLASCHLHKWNDIEFEDSDV